MTTTLATSRVRLNKKTPRVKAPRRPRANDAQKRFHMERAAKKKHVPGKPYFSPTRRCFMLNSTPLKGAHNFVKQTFFPPKWSPPRARASKAWRQMTLFGEVLTAQSGWERGTKVDNQIRDWANGKKLPRKPHPITNIVLREIAARGWTPGQGHVVVCSSRHRLGTAADARVLDKNGRGILLEIKVNTSERPYSDQSGDPPLKGPLGAAGRRASSLNFAQLQLALTVNLFQRTFFCEPAEAFVVEATAEKAIFHPLEQWAKVAVADRLKRA